MKTITNLLFLVFISLFVAGCGGGGGDDGDDDIDNEPPNTTISSAPASLTNSTSADFTFASNEPGTIFRCALDDGALLSCTSPANFTGLTEGSHSFSIVAMDEAGNINPTPATYNWEIDVTPPDTVISSGPTDPTNSTSASFVFSSTEAASTFECSLNGGAFSSCTSPADFAGLAEGSRSFSVRATDAAGNTDATPAPYNWDIDITPPDTSITSGPADPTNSTSATFVFASTEAGSTFECSINGGAFANCTSPANFPGLLEGPNDFSVRATDVAGNTDATPAPYNWDIDITPPDTSITSGPADPTNSTSATFVFASTEAGSTFKCSINGGAFANCTSPANFPGLLEGPNDFSVRATDVAGNTDATPAPYNWDIDITPPDTSITSGPADPTNSTSATFVFTSTEAGSTFECSINGGAFANCTSPANFPGLLEGPNDFSVRATDVAGNTDLTPAVFDWVIDTGVVDNVAPDPTSIVINNNNVVAIVANVLNANLIASDNVGVTDYLITEHNANDPANVIPPYLDPLSSDINWVPITSTTSLDITIPYSLTQSYNVGDAVELCAWFMDAAGNISNRTCDTIIYGEDWETGIGTSWFADNGVWQVGTPSLVGPATCFTGAQCAGTVLDADYPPNTDSRLISATLTLPTAAPTQEVQLRFQNWFSYNFSDSGQVQVSVFDAGTSTFGAFVNVGTPVSSVSGGWSVKVVDLTAFAGETVRIAFSHTAVDSGGVSGPDVSSGWYIDDIEILQTTPAFTGDFEAGWADWFADNGVWQVGAATTGPGACLTGAQCAGTVLDGNYPPNTDSRLISATLTLPTVVGAQEVQLRFQNWFSYNFSDSGQVQVSVFDAGTSTFGAFVNVGTAVSSVSGGWSVKVVDLSAFAGETVRIAFNHVAADSGGVSGPDVSSGWYIDDIEIVQVTPAFTGDFEAGWADWSADNGVWQVGAATAGPGACLTGAQCAGTVLDGDYPPNTDSRLISATLTLPTAAPTQEVQLRFQNWFSYGFSDSGQVQVSVFDAGTSTFGAFVNVGTAVSSVSGGWSVKVVDLSAFAGETVRIAFNHVAADSGGVSGPDVSSGWYIDDIEILQTTPAFTGDFEAGWADWFADNGVWQVGAATTGPGACLTGAQCAGTVLDGNYPPNTDSRLISATLTLPTVVGAQEVQLRFQNWFSYGFSDSGQVQVSVFDAGTSTFGAFVNVGTAVSSVSGGWSVRVVDLSAFAGETVRIAFNHVAADSGGVSGPDVSSGWYIDDIEIVQVTPAFTGDFEAGWADWSADNGVWQVGAATTGPGACLTGAQCAGTVLDGDYPPNTDSRLISATLTLPTAAPTQEVQLRFQNWFSYNFSDSGQVQVSVFDAGTSTFGAFVNVGTAVSSVSGGWSVKVVDLSAFAGETVRIAFNHVAADSGGVSGPDVSSGWYIDEIEIFIF